MAIIKCCRYCVAPKRYPGCHGSCAEYLAEKAEYDRLKGEYDRKRAVECGIFCQRADRVDKAMRNRRKGS